MDPETGILGICSEFPSEPETQKEKITSSSSLKKSTNSDDIPHRKWGVDDKDAQISYYIHKKFRNQNKIEEVNDTLIAKESIMDIALLSQSEDRLNLKLSLKKSSTETRGLHR